MTALTGQGHGCCRRTPRNNTADSSPTPLGAPHLLVRRAGTTFANHQPRGYGMTAFTTRAMHRIGVIEPTDAPNDTILETP